MIITEKMIRELQRRVDISYEDAEKFLRRAGGNIDIAEAYAKKRSNSFGNRLFREFEKIINATLIYRVRVYKGDDQFVNIPILGFLIVLFLIGVNKTLLLGVVFIILALLADCNLQINKMENQDEFRFYKTVNKEDVSDQNENKQTMKETDNKDNDNLNLQNELNIKVKSTVNLNQEANNQEANNQEANNQEGNYQNKKQKDLKNEEDDDYYEVTIDK